MARILRTALAAGAVVAALVRAHPAAGALETVRLAGPTIPSEIADETRPVAQSPILDEHGSFAVRAPLPPALTPGSQVVASAGLPPAPRQQGSSWRLELQLLPAGDATRALRLAERTLDTTRRPGDAGWHNLTAPLPTELPEGSVVVLSAYPAGDPPPRQAPRLGLPRVLAPGREPPRRNVILVSLDTLRADRLSVAGADRPTSPRLDALARSGVRFATALAPATSTPPSHMTMLTGTLPCRHGIFGIHVEDRLPEDVETLAQILARNGYTTAAITEDAYVGAPYGFARGFDSFREIKQEVADGNSPAPGVITPTGYGPTTFAEANDWLQRHRDERFFLFVHTYHMHAPRRPPEPYASLFRDAAGPEPAPSPGFDPAFHDRIRYDQLVRQADDLIAELLRTLGELGLERDTLLVVTSDHGEAFFEHGDHGHGFSLWEEVTRVPLILSAPGLAQARVVEEPVGLADIVPTVLDLLGLEVPGALDGRSLARLVTGATPEPDPGTESERGFYLETAPGNVRAVRDGRYKLVRYEDGRELLFDLVADPGEKRDLSGVSGGIPEERLVRLRTVLERSAYRCRTRREEAARARTGATTLDAERRDKLRALGYAE